MFVGTVHVCEDTNMGGNDSCLLGHKHGRACGTKKAASVCTNAAFMIEFK
jgi:hypothetical protein